MTQFIDTMLQAQQYRANDQTLQKNELANAAAQAKLDAAPAANQLASRVVGGDYSVLGQLVQLNPELAQTAQELGLKQGADARTQAENAAKYTGTYLKMLREIPQADRAALHARWVSSPLTAAVLPRQLLAQAAQQSDFSDAEVERQAAMFGQSTQPEYSVQSGTGPDGKPAFAYIPKRPTPGPVQTVRGFTPEDPAAKAPKISNNLQLPPVSVDPKTGQVTIGITPSTRSDVEKGVLEDQGVLSSLAAIQRGYKPEYQQFGTRAGLSWDALRAAFDARSLTPAQSKSLEEFSTYRSEAAQNLSAIIKSLAGSAVSAGEADRILSFIPNAGTGIFDGDNPVTFQAKLSAATQRVKLALARKQYALSHGIALDQIQSQVPLEGMRGVMAQRLSVHQQEAAQRGLTGAAANRYVRQAMKTEFGQ